MRFALNSLFQILRFRGFHYFRSVKILVIRFSSIGDCVLTTPVLRCLNEQVAGAEVHVLVKPAFASVFANNPNISKIWLWQNGVVPALKAQGFDYIVDLHHNLRSLRVKTALRCKSSSFPKLNIEKFLLVKFGVNRLPNMHVVDRYFDAVKALGVENDNKGLDYFPSAADAAIAEKLPASFANKYTAVVCGALQGTKRIPEEKLLNYCNAIRGNIVLIGGPAEAELGARLEAALGNRSISFCGKTSIGESAVLLQNAKSVLSPDTGMMHLAAAFKKPIAVVWGNTVPAFGMGPYMPDKSNSVYNAEVANLQCRPCSKIGFNACPKKHFNCMNLQQAEPLIQWINSVNEAV